MPGPERGLRLLLRAFADFVFPPVCIGCDREVDHGLLCTDCHTRLRTGRLGLCPACGRPLRRGIDKCGRCSLPIGLTRIRALGPYAPPYNLLIHALKYDNKTVFVPVLAGALTGLVESDPELSSADAICPVPLHRSRLRERGYNQAELLAREVGSGTGIACRDLLVRVRNTASQTGLDGDDARKRNVHGAFRVRSGVQLDGDRIILLDDVFTSGATLDAAGRQLLAAGASSVVGVVIAAA